MAGLRPAEVDGVLRWTGEVPANLPTDGDPLAALRTVVEELHSEPLPGLPPLTGGLVGYLTGYGITNGFASGNGRVEAVGDVARPRAIRVANERSAQPRHRSSSRGSPASPIPSASTSAC